MWFGFSAGSMLPAFARSGAQIALEEVVDAGHPDYGAPDPLGASAVWECDE